MRVLSGIQPTGRFHWGNYFGAIRQYIALQDNEQAFYFIADLHALTTVHDPAQLSEYIRDVAIELLALGLDPQKATLFRQSDVPEVSELTWLLMTVTPMHLLEKCHAYKDKKAKGLPADAGLFTYPVLMAADILLYDSDVVPVGADQVQHIEVTRDIAAAVQSTVRRSPDASQGARRGRNGQGPGHRRRKDVEELRQHNRDLRRAQKAPQKDHVDQDRLQAGRSAQGSGHGRDLRPLQALRDARAAGQLAGRYRAGGMGYGEAKQLLYEASLAYFAKARERHAELSADAAKVDEILHAGAARARKKGREVLERVRRAAGLAGPKGS